MKLTKLFPSHVHWYIRILHQQVRVFNFLTGKLKKVLDESLKQVSELQQVEL